jgi:hypothetical protein
VGRPLLPKQFPVAVRIAFLGVGEKSALRATPRASLKSLVKIPI